MRHMKFLTCVILALAVCFMFIPANAQSADDREAAFLNEKGILVGSNGNMMLDKPFPVEQLITVIARLMGEDGTASRYPKAPRFTDVPKGRWSAPYIAWAQSKGLVEGNGDGTLGYLENVNAQRLSMFMLRVLGYKNVQWNDAFKTAAEKGLLENVSLTAGQQVTRGDVAKIIFSSLKAKCSDGAVLAKKLGIVMPAPECSLSIASNQDPVYWTIDKNTGNQHWFYALVFNETNGIGFKVKDIQLTPYIGKYAAGSGQVINSETIAKWWGTDYIEAYGVRGFSGGTNRSSTEYYMVTVDGTDDNGNQLTFSYKMNMSQLSTDDAKAAGNGSGTVDASAPKPDKDHDTQTLRQNASFCVRVANGVNWVPANTLGKSDLTNAEVKALIGKKPEEIQAKIDTLYEAIQYLQAANFKNADDNIRIREGEIDWEHHKPGYLAVTTNEGCCATDSNLLNYLLKGDYDEVGFIAHSQSDGSGHVYNYIKQSGKYYFVDLTHYRTDFMNTALESGKLTDYYKTDIIAGNIHQSNNLLDFVNYYKSKSNNPPVVYSAYMAENVLPIDGVRKDGNVYITYPDTYKNKVTVIYDDPNDKVKYVFETPPKNYPSAWEPYNTKY